jgi:hypothetical protein
LKPSNCCHGWVPKFLLYSGASLWAGAYIGAPCKRKVSSLEGTSSGSVQYIINTSSFIDLILRVAKPVIQDQALYVEVKESSERHYHQRIHPAIGNTVFGNQCNSVCFHYLSHVATPLQRALIIDDLVVH